MGKFSTISEQLLIELICEMGFARSFCLVRLRRAAISQNTNSYGFQRAIKAVVSIINLEEWPRMSWLCIIIGGM